MKVEIPENLKADIPQTAFGKILSATPVVMAVIATMLAGLSSSEMTRAQYDRSLAAQQQSKAGDQWNFFQAKRLRGAMQRTTMDLLRASKPAGELDVPTITAAAAAKPEVAALLASESGQNALRHLQSATIPAVPSELLISPEINAAESAVASGQSEPEIAKLMISISIESLNEAIAMARDRVASFEQTTDPINKVVDKLDAFGGSEVTLARTRYSAMRYEAEARLNQSLAQLFELQVRKSNLSAERHHVRSQRFFYGMLGAQLGVIISTFAMAARNRNTLWAMAAASGLVALLFALYVYLYV